MFERFSAQFAVTGGDPGPLGSVGSAAEWVAVAGGTTFAGGLYRVHTVESASDANAEIAAVFPEFAGQVACFGFDWLGRQLATDLRDGASADPGVLLFEPGTGEALEIPSPFSAFHDEEMVDYADAVLASTFFDEWRASGGAAPEFTQCVGYRQPLFLGGQDTVDNLELTDMAVYWSLTGQLLRQVRYLPAGTPIGGVQKERP